MWRLKKKITTWVFPGGPVVKNSPGNSGNSGSTPGLATKIPANSQLLSLYSVEPTGHN